ncbi:MAG: hypothetical protein WC722_13670 [Rhodospirillales bacterium]|jgi:hypothetical protein
MSLSIGNRLNGIIPRGALVQARSTSEASDVFAPADSSYSGQAQLQHGRARDLAGTMPPASWQVLANASEHPTPPESAQINRSYGYVAAANHLHANPKENRAA